MIYFWDKYMKLVLGLFFICFVYFYNVENTLLFINDTARDTLTALRLWQQKDITLVGPPASFSLNSLHQIYFGSLTYYLAIGGLILANFNPIGASFHIGLLMILSIPFGYKLYQNWLPTRLGIWFAMFITYLSPLTVVHMRFYWNPNPLIPLSIFYFYFCEQKPRRRNMLILGMITAVMINFHYISLLLIPYIFVKFRDNLNWVKFYFFSLLLGLSPFFVSEIKNNGFMVRALVDIFFHNNSQFSINLNQIWAAITQPYLAILGIQHAEIDYPNWLSRLFQILVGVMVCVGLLIQMTNWIKLRKWSYVYIIFLVFIIGWITNSYVYHARYVFIFYPVLVYTLVHWIARFSFGFDKFVSGLFIVIILVTTMRIVWVPEELSHDYVNVSTLEYASRLIMNDQPVGKYNISENLHGDAQAIGLRYFLEKQRSLLADEKDYQNLDRLYVLSSSYEKTIEDNRWEYNASGPWKLIWIQPVNGFVLLRLDHDSLDLSF